LADAQDTLDLENREAWRIYERLCTRFALDLRLTSVVFPYVLEAWSSGDVVDLLDRLTLMHEVLNPPPPTEDATVAHGA